MLALAFGRFLLARHLAKRKLLRARRLVPLGATTMIKMDRPERFPQREGTDCSQWPGH